MRYNVISTGDTMYAICYVPYDTAARIAASSRSATPSSLCKVDEKLVVFK